MNPMTLTTRPAMRNDLPGLLDLYQHLAPGDDRPTMDNAAQVFERFLSCEGSAIFVGEVGVSSPQAPNWSWIRPRKAA